MPPYGKLDGLRGDRFISMVVHNLSLQGEDMHCDDFDSAVSSN